MTCSVSTLSSQITAFLLLFILLTYCTLLIGLTSQHLWFDSIIAVIVIIIINIIILFALQNLILKTANKASKSRTHWADCIAHIDHRSTDR